VPLSVSNISVGFTRENVMSVVDSDYKTYDGSYDPYAAPPTMVEAVVGTQLY
jgi:hypothetical protein